MTFLTALPWRKILPALAVLAILAAAYFIGRSDGRNSRNGEVATLKGERDTALLNVGVLTDGLNIQNAEVDRLAQAGATATKQAADAVAGAKAKDGQIVALQRRLDRVKRAPLAGPCESPEADKLSRDVWGKL